MTLSLFEVWAAGDDTLLETKALKSAGYHMLEIHFLSNNLSSQPNFKNIKKNWKLECWRWRASEHFPLLHLFLVPNIVKILATNTSELPTMYYINILLMCLALYFFKLVICMTHSIALESEWWWEKDDACTIGKFHLIFLHSCNLRKLLRINWKSYCSVKLTQ